MVVLAFILVHDLVFITGARNLNMMFAGVNDLVEQTYGLSRP